MKKIIIVLSLILLSRFAHAVPPATYYYTLQHFGIESDTTIAGSTIDNRLRLRGNFYVMYPDTYTVNLEDLTSKVILYSTGGIYVDGEVIATSYSGTVTSATYATTSGTATYATSAGTATYATDAGTLDGYDSSEFLLKTGGALTGTVTGTDISLTYGISASTGVFTSSLTVTNNISAKTVTSTCTYADDSALLQGGNKVFYTTPSNMSAGTFGADVICSSGGVGIIGKQQVQSDANISFYDLTLTYGVNASTGVFTSSVTIGENEISPVLGAAGNVLISDGAGGAAFGAAGAGDTILASTQVHTGIKSFNRGLIVSSNTAYPPANGMIMYNSGDKKMWAYTDDSWSQIDSAGGGGGFAISELMLSGFVYTSTQAASEFHGNTTWKTGTYLYGLAIATVTSVANAPYGNIHYNSTDAGVPDTYEWRASTQGVASTGWGGFCMWIYGTAEDTLGNIKYKVDITAGTTYQTGTIQ